MNAQTNPAVALAAASPLVMAGVSPELTRLLAARAVADEQLDLFYNDAFNPAVERHNAAVLAHEARIAAIPHVREEGGASIGGNAVVFTTALRHSRSQAEHYVTSDATRTLRNDDWEATVGAARRFIAADDARKAAIDALGTVPPIALSLREEEARLCAALDKADHEICDYPATSLADLAAKLDHIDFVGTAREGLLTLVRADVHRLGSAAA